jgi:hypothetical protein
VSAARIDLRLANQAEWIKIFDPRDWTIFVPSAEALDHGRTIRIDLDVGGWMVTLRGNPPVSSWPSPAASATRSTT